MSARILIGRTSNRHGDFMMSIQRRESKSAGWFSSSKFSASNFLNICATILLMVVAQPSFADSQLSTALVRLENVRISAGDIGDDAQVRFLIFNETGKRRSIFEGYRGGVAKSSTASKLKSAVGSTVHSRDADNSGGRNIELCRHSINEFFCLATDEES